MAGTGCNTTLRCTEWDYEERIEDVINSVLGDASPPWEVSIATAGDRNWVVVARRDGDAPYSALLTDGLQTPQHMRWLISEFGQRSSVRAHQRKSASASNSGARSGPAPVPQSPAA